MDVCVVVPVVVVAAVVVSVDEIVLVPVVVNVVEVVSEVVCDVVPVEVGVDNRHPTNVSSAYAATILFSTALAEEQLLPERASICPDNVQAKATLLDDGKSATTPFNRSTPLRHATPPYTFWPSQLRDGMGKVLLQLE